jgi:hypothetical protein
MAKSRPAGISAFSPAVPPPGALIQASHLIGRHCQRSRSLGIAASDGNLSFGPGQGSLGRKNGTREQHGEQDTKHKAHGVTPSSNSAVLRCPFTSQKRRTSGHNRISASGQNATWSPNASVCAVSIYFESPKELRATVEGLGMRGCFVLPHFRYRLAEAINLIGETSGLGAR